MDIYCPHEVHHLVGAEFEVEPGVVGSIGVHRPPDAAGFEALDRDMMALLFPHLRQMLRLVRRASLHERSQALTFQALAALSVGVFVVNANAQVRLMNSAAERIVRANLGVRASAGRVSLADVRLTERLRAAIRAAALAPLGRSMFAGETIVARTREGAPISLMVSPLPPEISPAGPAEALAAVFVGDPAANLDPSMEMVRAAYRLTPAETRVLFAIVNGQRPSDYAAANGISQNTVHTQLKTLFAKTGCHRQADLVRKVMADPVLRLAQNFKP